MATAEKQNVKSIYVITGRDEFLISSQIAQLIEKLLRPEEITTALWQADADKVSPAEVFDELRTVPFLASRRVVVLTDADNFVSKNRQLLEKYFENPSPNGVLILTVETWQSNTRLAKMLPSVGQLIEISQLKSKSLISYIQNYARKQHNKNLPFNAAQMLVEFVGDTPGMLCSEVDKLAAYVNSAKIITEKDIISVVGRSRFFNAFEIINFLTVGDTSKALEKLRVMFATDRDAEYTIVGAFAWHFRRMFNAAAMLSQGGSKNEIARKLGLWNADEFFRSVSKLPLQKIGDCLKRLAEIDYDIKTGRATAATAMETFIADLVAEDH